MLYQVYEFQRSILNPLTAYAQAQAHWLNHPMNPFLIHPLNRRVAAGYELLYRLGKEYEKPQFGLEYTRVDGVEYAVAEEVVARKPFCRVLRFKKLDAEHLSQPKVLIFAPLSGHFATLLRDTVRAMLPDFDVYITDWADAKMVPLSAGRFHLNDYVTYCIEFMQRLAPNLHVMSVCQPTVPVMAAVSIMSTLKDPKRPVSMTMMGGPIDPRCSPTQVNNLATTKSFDWFELNVIATVPEKYPGAGRRVYPGFMQHAGFVAMNPDRHFNSHWDYYQDLIKGDLDDVEAHRKFYDEYNAVLDLDADYYLATIKTVFQDHALPKGTWDVMIQGKPQRVRPQDITDIALLTVEGELDDISGPGQTQAAHTLCTGIPESMQKDFVAEGAGHYGIFSGRRWREIIYPVVREFMHKHEAKARSRKRQPA
ncbi:polyhydroxyalkanoate depolymerase [Piscinibacterium candidicorallinum]|uniref:Polyhydroxyalkanoate depolymerase n=1 Tax=Piscinibacterium candidicorallinum TaxID=1793872 RepID=A0ABV7H425_9BURK